MLIYNFQKEFLGIDEKDLRAIGFKDLAELRTEVSDFADLFVKTPGYIHNFKHVHWIDFITCAESNEESKVIINVNNKNYRATLQITTIFLVDSPSSKAYSIHLGNLRELTAKESENISGDITPRTAPEPLQAKPIFNSPDHSENFVEPEEINTITPDPYEAPLEIDMNEEEDLPLDVDMDIQDNSIQQESIDDDYVAPLDIDLDVSDNFMESPQIQEEVPQEAPTVEQVQEPIPTTKTKIVTEPFDNGYTYDPHIASEELGLPIELIEEFIQDFIEQAKEFKDGLYKATQENDLDNLKILSHKLKGVAANLRIEDALEVLTTINTSSDFQIIRENLDTLYKIIAKLSHEDVITEVEVPDEDIQEEVTSSTNDDLYSDPLEINDEDVPDKIDLLELEDDTFEEKENLSDDADDSVDLLDIDEDLELAFKDDLKDNSDEISVEPVVNYSKEKTANAIGLDVQSFNELFEDYLSDAKSFIISIREAIQNQDFSTCKNNALKLKGMSDNMKIDDLTQDLEILINSQDKDELTKTINTIDAYIAQLAQ